MLKLGFGTSALYAPGILPRKVDLAADHGVCVYPGGTFLEVAVLQGRIPQFLGRARTLGFGAIEVSNGVVPVAGRVRRDVIQKARGMGFRVLAEVGSKDAGRQPPAAELAAQAQADLEAGADYIICEARENGRGIGIYDGGGSIKEADVAVLAAAIPPERMVWEAPDKGQQQALMAWFGVNVNLGNVAPGDVLALEAMRTGLRADTMPLPASLPLVAGAEAPGDGEV